MKRLLIIIILLCSIMGCTANFKCYPKVWFNKDYPKASAIGGACGGKW